MYAELPLTSTTKMMNIEIYMVYDDQQAASFGQHYLITNYT